MTSVTVETEIVTNGNRQGNIHEAIYEFPTNPTEQQQRQQRLRTYVVLILSLIIVLIFIDAKTTRYVEQFYTSLIDWLSSHLLFGIVVVILVYIIATVLFIPGSILTIGTGYAFHQALQQQQQHYNMDTVIVAVLCSSFAVLIGAALGSIICFLLGRYLFRDHVVRMANRYEIFRAVDRALEGNGFKIMILLRLSPLIPYNALDYISGITSISIAQYSLALIGIIPGTITFCYIGATASTFTDGTTSESSDGRLHTTILVLGVFFALTGAAVASYYSKIELDKIIAENVNRDDFTPLDTTDQSYVVESSIDDVHNNNHSTFTPTTYQLQPIDSTPLT